LIRSFFFFFFFFFYASLSLGSPIPPTCLFAFVGFSLFFPTQMLREGRDTTDTGEAPIPDTLVPLPLYSLLPPPSPLIAYAPPMPFFSWLILSKSLRSGPEAERRPPALVRISPSFFHPRWLSSIRTFSVPSIGRRRLRGR